MNNVTNIVNHWHNDMDERDIHLNTTLLYGLFSSEVEANPSYVVDKIRSTLEQAVNQWDNVLLPGSNKPIDLVRIESVRVLTPNEAKFTYIKPGSSNPRNPKLNWNIKDKTMLPIRIVFKIYDRSEVVKIIYIPASATIGGNIIKHNSPRQLSSELTDTDIAIYGAKAPNVVSELSNAPMDNTFKIFMRFHSDKLSLLAVGLHLDQITYEDGEPVVTQKVSKFLAQTLNSKRNSNTAPASEQVFKEKNIILPTMGYLINTFGLDHNHIIPDFDWVLVDSLETTSQEMLESYTWFKLTHPVAPLKSKERSSKALGIRPKADNPNSNPLIVLDHISNLLYYVGHYPDIAVDDINNKALLMLTGIMKSTRPPHIALHETRVKLINYDNYLSSERLAIFNGQLDGIFEGIVEPLTEGCFTYFIKTLQNHLRWGISAKAISLWEGAHHMSVVDGLIDMAVSNKINRALLPFVSKPEGEFPTEQNLTKAIKQGFGKNCLDRVLTQLTKPNEGSDNFSTKGVLESSVQSYLGSGGITNTSTDSGNSSTSQSFQLGMITASTFLSRSPSLTVSGAGGKVVLNPFIELDDNHNILFSKTDLLRMKQPNDDYGNLQQLPTAFTKGVDFSEIF